MSMNNHLHDGIDLENTKIVWTCEDCEKVFDDDGSYQSDICPYCGSEHTVHEHVKNINEEAQNV